MKKTHTIIRRVAILVALWLLILLPFSLNVCTAMEKSVTVENGWVSIHSENRQIMDLLKELVHELDIELFLVVSPENKPITLNVTRIAVPKAVSRVLNGYDYAVVYLNQQDNKIKRRLVMIPVNKNAAPPDIPFDDPIVNFDETFWQTFTPHKYLGGYNIIFMPFSFKPQKERKKELTVAQFIQAYEDRIKMIQEELNETYAEKEFTRWVVSRARKELEFYKAQLEMMPEEQE